MLRRFTARRKNSDNDNNNLFFYFLLCLCFSIFWNFSYHIPIASWVTESCYRPFDTLKLLPISSKTFDSKYQPLYKEILSCMPNLHLKRSTCAL